MPARLGLPAIVIACALLVAAPAQADDTTTATTATSTTTTTTVPATAPATSDVATTTPLPTPAAALDVPADGPATPGGQTPVRGTQFQISPPPPPPPTPPPAPILPAWAVVPGNSGSGRRVVYSKSQQAVWVFDANNTVIKLHRVSGKRTPYDPAPGVYRVYSRSIRTYSINNPSITWGYMIRFAKGADGGNIGFHEIPYQYGRPVQSEAQLGQALSGGCVRQAVSDAIWMWNWAGVGTVVVVTP